MNKLLVGLVSVMLVLVLDGIVPGSAQAPSNSLPLVWVLSTGGTIAGRGASPTNVADYKGGQILGEDLVKAVPESYLLGDRAVYIDAFLASKGALSPDGLFPAEGAATALRALQSIDESMKTAHVDLAAAWTNDFARKAGAKKQ